MEKEILNFKLGPTKILNYIGRCLYSQFQKTGIVQIRNVTFCLIRCKERYIPNQYIYVTVRTVSYLRYIRWFSQIS